MSGVSHTPAPWQQHDREYCPEEIWGNLEGPLEDGKVHGTHICTVEDNGQMKANARLIAAAPDLLAALIAVRDAGHLQDAYTSTADMVDDAIAAATGDAA